MTVKAFFFGAGSSRGTLDGRPCCPPVAAEFGKKLAEIQNWPHEYPAIAQVVQHLGAPTGLIDPATALLKIGLVEIWSCIDYYAKLNDALPTAAPWCDKGSRDLKRALLRLYGQDCDQEAEKLLQLELGDYTLGQLLSQAQPGDTLISFNYDTLVERLARKFGCCLRNFYGGLRSDVVNFAKPHGSTSWCLDLNEKRVIWTDTENGPLLTSLDEDGVYEHREPLLLGAVPIKSELIGEVQRYYQLDEVFRVVMRQWRAVVEAVRKSDVLFVVGYSFPKEDQYGRFLLREAMRVRSSDRRSPPKIEYYELPEQASATAASILDALGPCDGLELVWRGKVLPPPTER